MDLWDRYLRRKKVEFRSRFKSSTEVFDSACDVLIKCFYVCGGERMKPNYNWYNPRMLFLMTDLIVYLFINFYSIYRFWGQPTDVIFCLVTLGIAIQGLAKIECFTGPALYDLHHLNVMRFNAKRRYPEDEESLFHTATLCKIFIHTLLIPFAILFTIVSVYAIVIPIVSRKLVLPFGFILPFIDMTKPIGFAVNWLFQEIQTVEASFGLMACEACLLFLIISAAGQIDLISLYLHRLSELVESNGDQMNDRLIEEILEQIVEKHVALTKYVSDLDKLVKKQLFVNFTCIVFELVISLAITMKEMWYPGYAITFICTVQLLINCSLGTFLSIKNDKLIEEIYNATWYGLPPQSAKVLQQMLCMSQNPVVMSDGFTKIDLYYFVEIYKKIYSYLMVLQNMS